MSDVIVTPLRLDYRGSSLGRPPQKEAALTPETLEKDLDEIVAPWKDRDGNLIMVLHQIQNRYGYVPRNVAFEVARRLNVPLARIYEVITFYHYFKLESPGKHIVSVCMGTACYLKGAPAVLSAVEKELGVKAGQTTSDRNFHVQTVRCVGCCGLSPVVTIDQKVLSRVQPEPVPLMLAEYREKPGAAKE